MLKQRVLSAVILIPLVALLAWLGGWWFTLFIAFYAGVTAWELLRLVGMNDFAQPVTWLGVVLAALLVAEGGWPTDPWRLQGVLVGMILLGLVIALFLNRPRAGTDMLLTLAAGVYLGMTLRFVALMRLRENGLMWLLVMAITVWVMDSGAYFTGRALGRHKLWPRISPKKTWEGFLGGWIAGIVVAAGLTPWLIPALGLPGLVMILLTYVPVLSIPLQILALPLPTFIGALLYVAWSDIFQGGLEEEVLSHHDDKEIAGEAA